MTAPVRLRFFLPLLCLGAAALAPMASASTEDLVRTPFASPSAGDGHTLFTRLDPAATGLVVQNPYDDPQMWGKRYREFMGGGMGSGIAAGDYDGDGLVDLYVSLKTKPGRLFKNLGNWKFADVTDAAGLSPSASVLGWLKTSVTSSGPVIWHQGATFADVNNDGRLDLYVCRNDAPNLLFINQGDGTFKEEGESRGLAIVDGSVIGAFADYDRDGWLDVFIVTNQLNGTEPSGRPDRLFRNTGDGHFVEVTAASGISGGTFGHSAIWIDYDGDRWPDLYSANDFSGADRFFHNNHDGTFTNVLDALAPHTPYSSMGSDVADIDNNGWPDLLVADMATTSREKDRRGLAASRDDVLMTSTTPGMAPQYMRNALLLNTGRGAFREAACWAGLAATDWTWSIRFEDFDNDGWLDLHVTNGMMREANNSDLLARMMRALSDQERITVIKKSPPLNETNLAFRNTGGARFVPVTDAWGLTDVGVSFGAATADFDRDGDLDLVYLNHDGGLSIFRNDVQHERQHCLQVRLRGTKSNRFGVGAVIRLETPSGPQSRTLTVARGYASGSELVAHFGLGTDTSINRLIVEWPSGRDQVLTDLAADAAYLITEPAAAAAPAKAPDPLVPPPALFVAASTATSALGLIVEDRSTPAIPDKEQVFLPFRTDRRGPGLAIGDIDGDGHDDVYLSATTGSPARLLRWTTAGYVEAPLPANPSPSLEGGPALFLDVDGNGTRDLLVTRASANPRAGLDAFRPVIFSNDGQGNFTPVDALPDLSLNVGAACAADFDGDGDLDLFLGGRSVPGRYPETPPSVLLRNDHGRFTAVTAASPALASIGLVKSALFRDVDQDGSPDLILALEWDCVRYFHNDGGGRFTDRTDASGFASGGRGWWNSLACADLNADGRPDFVAGNLGLNTPYRATPEQPATLLYGDFAQDGTKLIAEAVYDGAERFPLRARADLGARLPFILRKFPKNDDFARATLRQVFGEPAVAAAKTYTADNLASGVFLSQPDGAYRFQPLPPVAQIGPIQGLVAADLDGDGLADLCAVQNTDAAVPRFDGGVGVFLKGRGVGTFDALEPARSGVIVPGNGRALIALDPLGNGRPDLLLTRHGGRSELLVNQTPAGVRWLKLQLRGGPGNPDAVGARLHLTFSNHTTADHEIALGGGWLSQPAPVMFVALPAGVRLVEARIKWPDAQTSRHVDPPDQGLWLIRK